MKKALLSFFLLALFADVALAAKPGTLMVSPAKPTVNKEITLIYTPLPQQQWMLTQNVYLYACLEMDGNGEWVKEKAEWSRCNLPNYQWKKDGKGNLSYTITNLKTYFGLSDQELSRVTGMFFILKNEMYQTTDKYLHLSQSNESQDAFNGTVHFSVKVPAGTQRVYVTGTFGPEGSNAYWKRADARFELKQVDATHFAATLNNVPADLEYLYIWGPRNDQTEFRLGHRPLGGRSAVNDIVEYWGDMTLNVTVPKGTTEVYVAGSFSANQFVQMMDAGNNTWICHIPPTALKGADTFTYKYYNKNSSSAVEDHATRRVAFEGFFTQYDEVSAWK